MGRFFVVFLVLLSGICLLASPVAAIRITLVGEVNDNQQIIADNEIYEVANNAVGDDLVLNHISQKVKVTGELKVVGQSDQTDEYKMIKVESFEVVEE